MNLLTEEEIFAAAIQKPLAERPAFLERACAGDATLRAAVEALLAAHDRPDSLLEAPACEMTVDSPHLTDKPGMQIGPYKLLQKLGEGGMGAVYLAEQQQPVKRQVALKIIKAGMDSAKVIARFEQERQALAIMDHPHIAKVLDAGTTDTGRLYFVMELVKGIPITRYCDQEHLTPKERLELFIPVCQAVQHAHQKGIIHRDLKPSNVLIALYDGRPVPKVIDFGVAKATSQKMTERTLFTEVGSIVGTLEYMAPEQAELNNLDIDTRADIYSLGVLLYELLTGGPPFSGQQLRSAGFNEMLRIIKEVEPQKPSTKLSSSAELPGIAANRHLEPARLTRLIRGDLDWIVMKCLEKERSRRYETANAFALDIQRYLHDEPVLAGPPSKAYRLKKFLRRNKGPALAAAIVLLTLVGGIIGTTWGLIRAEKSRQVAEAARASETARAEAEAQQRQRAESAEATARTNEQQAAEERNRAVKAEADANDERTKAVAEKQRADEEAAIAKAVKDFLQNRLLSQADPENQAEPLIQTGGASAQIKPNPTIRELLDRAAAELTPEKIETQFPNLPLVQAEILRTIGDTYWKLGEYGPTIALLERSRQLCVTHRGPDHSETLTTLNILALAYMKSGKYPEATKLFEQLRDKQMAILGPDHPDTLTTLHNLAWTYRDDQRYEQSIRLFEQVRDKRIATLGPDHLDTLYTLHELAWAYWNNRRYQESTQLFEQVRDKRIAKLGPDHPQVLWTLTGLGSVYQSTGKLPEAIQIFEMVREKRIATLGPDHPFTLWTLNNLGSAYWAAGRLPEAIQLYEQVRDQRTAKLGPDHPSTLTTLGNLAAAYQAAGKLPEATQLFEQAVSIARRVLGPTHASTALYTNNWCNVLDQARQFSKAADIRRERLDILRQQFPATDQRLDGTLATLGQSLLNAERFAEAEAILKENLINREKLIPDSWLTFVSKSSLGAALSGQKKFADAEPLLLTGYEGLKQRESKILASLRTLRLTEALQRLIDLYTAWDKPDEAAKWQRTLAEHKSAAVPSSPPEPN